MSNVDEFVANGLAYVEADLAKQDFRATPSWDDLKVALASVLRYIHDDPDGAVAQEDDDALDPDATRGTGLLSDGPDPVSDQTAADLALTNAELVDAPAFVAEPAPTFAPVPAIDVDQPAVDPTVFTPNAPAIQSGT